MNILLTNDDGVDSPGIRLLADRLRSIGHRVLIMAPHQNRSGASQSISLHGDVSIRQVAEDTWACRGTPADCVLIMEKGVIPFDLDLVVSGINAGANLGTDLVYSATAGAARQAALYWNRAIALSLAGNAPFLWNEAVHWSAAHLDELIALCAPGVFVNVNMPNAAEMRFDGKLTSPAVRHYADGYRLGAADADGWIACEMTLGKVSFDADDGCDAAAVERGLVAVSRIRALPSAVLPCSV